MHTYTILLEQIDKGNLPLWINQKAPEEAIEYYSMPPDAKFRDLILAVRADEACHREVNHHFADLKSWEDVEAHHVELVDPKAE